MKHINISVPGKIHLLGEHTVVYGKPALISAINLRITILCHSGKSMQPESRKAWDSGRIEFAGMTEKDKTKLELLRTTIEEQIKQRFSIKKIPPYQLEVKSELPIGSGLGSSAGLSAGFAAALLKLSKLPLDLHTINELAYQGEKIFHGNPSGGDNATVVYGGLLWYRKETDFIKTFTPLPFTIHKNIKQFILINSGKPLETTREMVGKVRGKWQESRVKIEKIFDDQEQLTKDLAIALKDGNEKELIKIIKNAEGNLEKLGVVGKKASEIVKQIEKLGGAAKISGAGGFKSGSGMILAYHNNLSKILKLSKKNAWQVYKIKLGEDGLE